MTRRKKTSPLPTYSWLAEAGWVFLMHSAQLMANPAKAGARLAALGAEKQQAFAEGAMKAAAAAVRGAGPDRIVEAAMRPARSRVRANARRIRTGRSA
ncbi:hypothetical protein ACRC7T_03640 [Segnochrobactraceae bacterium EtOH-i3]